jgi:hypothetical protein
MHGYSTKFVADGQALLDADCPIAEKCTGFLDFLSSTGVAHPQVMHTKHLLTHPKNRSSLLLNPYDAHRNGSMIKRVGARMAELHGAVCIEMSPVPEDRKA